MAGPSVLIIDESPQFRDYLAGKLESQGIAVLQAPGAVEGLAKVQHHRPSLVIADYFLSDRPLVSILKTKRLEPSIAGIPVIVCCSRLSRDKLLELTMLGVRRVFMKPLKIDQLWQAVGEALGQPIPLDDTPCLLDAHVNENVVFVEAALGLNEEKISLLGFKVQELLALHGLALPKFLVLMSGLDLKDADLPKLRQLLDLLIGFTKGRVKWVKVLTQSKVIESRLKALWEYGEMTVTDSFEKAMDELVDREKFESFLRDARPVESSAVEMRFDHDKALDALTSRIAHEGADLRVAVVDDDFIVQEIVKNTFAASGASVLTFDDGDEFLRTRPEDLDLILLDLMMPGSDGFEVMDRLKALGDETPVIVLSALSRRDAVLRAMSYGIRSYMTKPLKPDELLRKTFEVAGAHF